MRKNFFVFCCLLLFSVYTLSIAFAGTVSGQDHKPIKYQTEAADKGDPEDDSSHDDDTKDHLQTQSIMLIAVTMNGQNSFLLPGPHSTCNPLLEINSPPPEEIVS